MKTNFRSVFGILHNNWHLKLFAVLIAVVIWFLVVQYVNPEDTRKLENVHIEVNTVDSIPVAEGLILVTDYSETMTITYTAARDVIAMLDTQKIKAYVDISSATKSGEYSLPIRVDTGGQKITVVDQSVKEAVLKFEKRDTATVEIVTIAEGIVPEGYIKDEPECTPEMLSIEGPESKIAQIKTVEAIIPEKTFKETKSYSCEYRFLDANGNTVSKDYITADVDKIDVNVAVRKTKEIPITATIINTSGGYESNFASLYIKPSTIVVAGSDEVLETYNSYDLGAIDVSEKESNFTQSYVVTLQKGLKNVNEVSQIDVEVVFGDVVTKKIDFKSFKFLNVPDDQNVKIIDKSCTLTFRGVADDIAKLNADNIEIYVDLKDNKYGAGRHNIAIHAIIPNEHKVGVVGKYYLTVEVS